MRARAVFLRILVITTGSILTLLLLAFTTIQFQQQLLHYRTKRLLADFHQLDKDNGTWSDAKQVIARWHNWGYATGPCTPDHCIFTIQIKDTVTMRLQMLPEHDYVGFNDLHLGTPLYWMGWREGNMAVRFLVANGRVISKEISAWVGTRSDGYDYEYPVGVTVRAYPNLSSSKNYDSYESQMGQHPNYMASRPGGCTICMLAWINIAPHISNIELNQITNFNLDCFTRSRACQYPGEFLPSVASYHFYEEHQWPQNSPAACTMSPATRARDAKGIIIANAQSQSFVQDGDDRVEQDLMLPIITFKGVSSWTATHKVSVGQLDWYDDARPKQPPPRTTPGGRYILFLDDFPSADDSFFVAYCNVIADTPSARAEVMQGIADDGGPNLPPLSAWN